MSSDLTLAPITRQFDPVSFCQTLFSHYPQFKRAMRIPPEDLQDIFENCTTIDWQGDASFAQGMCDGCRLYRLGRNKKAPCVLLPLGELMGGMKWKIIEVCLKVNNLYRARQKAVTPKLWVLTRCQRPLPSVCLDVWKRSIEVTKRAVESQATLKVVYGNDDRELKLPLYSLQKYGGKDLFGVLNRSAESLPLKHATIEQGHIQRCTDIFLILFQKLARLHALGYAHGDLKPENMLYDATSKEAWLIDFEFAQRYDEPWGNYGTFGYIPPEFLAVKEGKEVRIDKRCADVWACGVALLEKLLENTHFEYTTGHCFWKQTDRMSFNFINFLINLSRPIREADEYRVLFEERLKSLKDQHQWEEFLHRALRHLPDQLADLLKNMLHLDPLQRPKIEGVIHSIENFRHNQCSVR